MIMQRVCEKPSVERDIRSVPAILKTSTFCDLGFFAKKSTTEFKENKPLSNIIAQSKIEKQAILTCEALCLKRRRENSIDTSTDTVDSKKSKFELESSRFTASCAPLTLRVPDPDLDFDAEYDQFVDIELAEINAHLAGVTLSDTREGIDPDRLFKSVIGSL